jgi:hypothetical protein
MSILGSLSKIASSVASVGVGLAQAVTGQYHSRPTRNKKGSLDPVENQDLSAATEILGNIYSLMVKARESEVLQKELGKKDIKDKNREEEDRNKEIIKALSIRRKPKKKPAPKKKAKQQQQQQKQQTEAKTTAKKEAKQQQQKQQTEAKTTAKKEIETAKKAEQVKPTAPKAPAEKVAEVKAPAAPKPSAGKIPTGAAAAPGLTGKAAMVAAAVGSLGITNAFAKQAIVATSAKESGLDPKSKEDGATAYLATLKNRGIDYIYKVFPQLKPGGRVAKQLNMPDGVPADYLQKEWSKGDEAFFSMVYDGLSTNSKPGDGYKYRGRGLIGITGRSVYRNVGNAIGVDLESNPDALTQDFDTASKAAAAYLAITLGGKGGSKKGFEIMNSFQDSDTALKTTLRAVAGLGHSESEFNQQGSHLQEQYRKASEYMGLGSSAVNASPTSSPSSGTKIDQSSKENKDMKAAAELKSQVNVNNTNITAAQNASKQAINQEEVDDRPPHHKKS